MLLIAERRVTNTDLRITEHFTTVDWEVATSAANTSRI